MNPVGPKKDTDETSDKSLFEFHPTEALLCQVMCAYMAELLTPKIVIEPSAGNGPFVKAARAQWPNATIIAVEPRADRSEVWKALRDAGADSIRATTWEETAPRLSLSDETCLILGNPPFSLAAAHISLGMNLMGHPQAPENDRYLAFLLLQSFLGSDERYQTMFTREKTIGLFGTMEAVGGLVESVNLIPRPSFSEDGKTDGREYMFGVWQPGSREPTYRGSWKKWKD